MKSQRRIVCSMLVAVIATGVMGLRITRAQKAQNAAPRSSGVAIVPSTGSASPVAGPIEEKIRQAAEKLRDAEDDEGNASARQELAQTLGQYFDEDMAGREREVAKLEERLYKLRAQLERRRAKRQDIIELQIQVAVNEADGLGFLSRPAYGSLPGQSMVIGAPSYGGPTIKLSHGDKSLVLPAHTPHQESYEEHQQSHEEHQQSHEESETGGDES